MQRSRLTDAERQASLERRRAANRKRMQMKREDPRYRQYERERNTMAKRQARTNQEVRIRDREVMRRLRQAKQCRNGTDNTTVSSQHVEEHNLCSTDGKCSFCGILHPDINGYNSCCMQEPSTEEMESVSPLTVFIKSEPGIETIIHNPFSVDEHRATDVAGPSEIKNNRLILEEPFKNHVELLYTLKGEPEIQSSTIQNSISDNQLIAVGLTDLKESIQEDPFKKHNKLVYPLKSDQWIQSCAIQNSTSADQDIVTTGESEIKGNTFINDTMTDICMDTTGKLCYIHNSYIYKDVATFMGRFMISCKEENCPAWGVLVKKNLFLSMGHTHEPVECDADKIKLYSILKNCGSTERLPYNFQVGTHKSAIEGAAENIILLLLNHLKDIRTIACTKDLATKLQQTEFQLFLPQDIDYRNFMSLYESLPELNIVKEENDTTTPNVKIESADAKAQTMALINEIKSEALKRYSSLNDEALTDHEKNTLKEFIFEQLGIANKGFQCIKVEDGANSAFNEGANLKAFENSITIKKENDDSCSKDSYLGLNLENEFSSIRVKDEENGETLYLMHIKDEPEEMESDFMW